MWKEVANGKGSRSLVGLPDYEQAIAEGQRANLVFNLRIAPSTNIIEALEDKLEAAGVTADLQTSGNAVNIIYRKGFPFLAVIVSAVLGLIVLAILIVSWRFFKEVAAAIPSPVLIGGVVIGIILIAVVAIILLRKQIPIGGDV